MTHDNLPGNSNVRGIITNVDFGPLSYSTGIVTYGRDLFSVKSYGVTTGLDIPIEVTLNSP